MFLRSLKISSGEKVIRNIEFHKGINLIVDETQVNAETVTGNNVGKTTVLKLIDFCLGGTSKSIYLDPETKKDEYTLVKNYLIEKKILITLILSDNLDDENSDDILIERNFLPGKNLIRNINGNKYTEDEFEIELSRLIFPAHSSAKPTFRQIISHNIRYKDENINNTLKTLDKYTTDVEYETLYLFLLGCDFSRGNQKQEIITKIKQETTFKNRLEKNQTKTAYETMLSIINSEIEELNKKKENLNLNENYEADLDKLNNIKYRINKLSSEINNLSIRKNLILESESDLKESKSDIDINQLKLIYQQATNKIEGIQKTFEELVHFHNQMIIEKVKYITKELPELEKNIKTKNELLKYLLSQEVIQSSLISKSDTFEELEDLISELTEKYRRKGEYESTISQLNEVDLNLKNFSAQLHEIENELFTDDFESIVKIQRDKFNKHFSYASNFLYGEKYALNYDVKTNKSNQRLYKFSAFNINMSSGKKQGEISCFDIAYTMFADEEGIPCLHFLLNDKKELMHDNQLVKIAELVNKHNIQFVASILKDKLPEELNKEKYFVIKLSQKDKLFRIENE